MNATLHRQAKTASFLTLLAIVGTMFLATPSSAQIERRDTDFDRMLHKLGRGIANVLTGWMEIPKEIAEAWRETDPITGLIVGTIKGVGYTIVRVVAGVYEILTFPMPFPENYEPIIEPEFVLPPIFGEDLPPFEDNSF
jgi:putative exosortase-associated protein (TIGR04073 family)